MNLEEKIKEWVATDNQVKLYQQKIKELKGFRGDISTEILDFVDGAWMFGIHAALEPVRDFDDAF